MHDDFVEKVEGWLEDGKSADFEYAPAKMHPYSLAKVLKYDLTEHPEIYLDILADKTNWVIQEAFNSRLLPSKPSKSDKDAFRENQKILKDVWRVSSPYLIKLALKSDKYLVEREHYLFSSEYNPRAGKINQMIFYSRLKNLANHYVASGKADNVLKDTNLIREVLANPSRFQELENLCEAPLKYFASNGISRWIDTEALLQEGRMVVWHCAPKYTGKNFARFSTLVSAALKNKAKDFSRFFSADKRRILKKTFSAGLGEKDSWLEEHLASQSFSSWKFLSDSDWVGPLGEVRPHLPFQSSAKISDFEVKHTVFEYTADEVDELNFPLGIGKNIELIREGDRMYRAGEDTEKYEEWMEECRRRAIENNPMIKKKNGRKSLVPF